MRRRKEEGEEEKRRIGNQELETLLQKPEASKVHQRKLVQNQVCPKPSSSKTKFVEVKQGQARASKNTQNNQPATKTAQNAGRKLAQFPHFPHFPLT